MLKTQLSYKIADKMLKSGTFDYLETPFVSHAVNTIIDLMSESVSRGEEVVIPKFGSFRCHKYINRSMQYTCYFKPSSYFHYLLNKNTHANPQLDNVKVTN